MLKKLYISIIFILLCATTVFAQRGVIKGRVYNSINNEPIPFANILIEGEKKGTSSGLDGNYKIENLKPGIYTVVCSFIGFKKAVFYEVLVMPPKITILDMPMNEEVESLAEVVVSSARFNKTEESPVSLRTISATEIYRSPGGDRDISKVIQILPGVASTVSFRNDIIVRGGAPNENRFFIDGIEVPNINHFATQGSSGGPVGMINVNFLRETDFLAGAFPANRGNALSSVIDFRQIRGNDEKLTGIVMLGSSDLGITLDGPSGDNSSFIFSARRSYLQFLFKLLKLPFLPTYNDFQYKHDFQINKKNKLTIIGLGAYDDFKLNESVNNDITDSTDIKRNNYILGTLPVNTQWNYTLGLKWTHFSGNSYQTIVVSRNHLKNSATKYQDNIEDPGMLLLDYTSQEIENKLRIESTSRLDGWKLNVGVGYERVRYTNSTFNKKELDGGVTTIDFSSELEFNKYSLFSQVSKAVFNERLILSLGVRTDFNDYSNDMINPLDQLSPRFSASYIINSRFSANFNVGRYFQLPAYTVMGYRDDYNNLVNKDNNITYINSNHIVTGLEYNPNQYAKITLEGFYKTYSNYPFLTDNQISLANLGGDFGVIGNEAAESTSKGRTYGMELLVQQKLISSVYGIFSYTWVRSEFQDKNGEYVPSSWDNKHILNLTAGYRTKNNWEFGIKFRLLGGAPYTPYDRELSSLKEVWNVSREGIYDWSKLNTKRNPVSHGLDIRVDKKWYFKRWTLDMYLDIQNIYNSKTKLQPYLDMEKDAAGNLVENPQNPAAYKSYEIENTTGTILPSIGVMIEF